MSNIIKVHSKPMDECLVFITIITIAIFIYLLYSIILSESLKYCEPFKSYSDHNHLFAKPLDFVKYDPNIVKDQIFVSIASYRDPQALKTVTNLINNSSKPKNIWIYVLEQNGPDDPSVSDLPTKLLGKSNVNVETISHLEAKGPNWARYLIQKKWGKEEYYLQIDSHTLFTENWDTDLIKMVEKLGDKTVLTQYPPEYNLNTGEFDTSVLRSGLYVEGVKVKDNFTRIQSEYSNKDQDISKPFNSEAWGACFSFSKSNILRDAPYDPYLPYLFFGEELDITLRLYTRGWKFYSPRKSIVFTSFKRGHRNTIWSDHDITKREEIETLSRLRLYRKFGFDWLIEEITGLDIKSFDNSFSLINKDIEKFKLGDIKSLNDYQLFAGVDFRNKTVIGSNRKRIINIGRPKQLSMNNIWFYELFGF
jgi:[Skp1-protein]-hydroxyproline N-acetylglucosaminyltransferase